MKMIAIAAGLLFFIPLARPVLAQDGSSAGKPVVSSSAATAVAASAPAPAADSSDKTAAGIPVGTTITTQNWRDYQQYMPAGMIGLFQGEYYWKMPADVQMTIGPTIIHPLPRNYVAATEKYASQIRIVDLPTGGLSMQGYQGGMPFPNPAEPHRGWKILADVWYRYLPHLIVDTYGTSCSQNNLGNISCSADELVLKQLSFNTDPGIPATIPGAGDTFSTEWFMTVEPENERYNASVVISYTDLAKPQAVYAFIPSLRRSQPVSSSARCSQYSGTDYTSDDYRYGFNANLTQMQVTDLGDKKILALVDADLPTGAFPDGFDMPLGWPKPSWGKWQVRDAYVISASKVPSQAEGYCYGKRVMYVDKASGGVLWLDLYDTEMHYWKFGGFVLKTIDVPGVGPVNCNGAAVEMMWDMHNQHASFFSDPALNHSLYVNQQAPAEFNDLTRFSTASGLNQIMQ